MKYDLQSYVDTEFAGACSRLVDVGDKRIVLMPDTPEGVAGNAQYHFLARILPHAEELTVKIQWPSTTRSTLPGFLYPGNENFSNILHQVCYRSERLDDWYRIEDAVAVPGGAEVRLPPSDSPHYLSVGIPFPADRYERLICDLASSDLCEVEQIGSSRGGNPLHGLFFRDRSVAPRGLFLLQAYQHHTEWAGLFILEKIARGLATGEMPCGEFAWAIVPCINVDALLGGWREDCMYNPTEEDTCGNFNRDWDTFRYPETTSARDYYCRVAADIPVLHGIDIHMGWSSSKHSGGGLTVSRDGVLGPRETKRERGFTDAFFDKVPIEPFAWEVTEPNRPNFAAWVWREFSVPGQTLELSRFQGHRVDGGSYPVDQKYYESLGAPIHSSLVDFYMAEVSRSEKGSLAV
jgi:hypothetical protein